MAKVIDILHDSIDQAESLRERARGRADSVLKNAMEPFVRHLRDAAKDASEEDKELVLMSLRDALAQGLQLAAEDIAEALDDLTTEGVRSGFENGRKLSTKGGRKR